MCNFQFVFLNVEICLFVELFYSVGWKFSGDNDEIIVF